MSDQAAQRLLDHVDAELDALDADDPELLARLRTRIAEAVRALDLPPTAVDLTTEQAAALALAVVADAATARPSADQREALERSRELAGLRAQLERHRSDPRSLTATPARGLLAAAARRGLDRRRG